MSVLLLSRNNYSLTAVSSELQRMLIRVQTQKLGSIYYAIIESHLRYTDVIWDSLPTRKAETLQRLQNRTQLIIESARVKDAWFCDWLNDNNLISLDRLVMMYMIMSKLRAESLWDRFKLKPVHSNLQVPN